MPILKHDERGLLTMNIADRYGIGSHFVITLKPDSGLDRFHVVFGKIIRGFKTLDKITEAPVGEGATVQVSDCGEYARIGICFAFLIVSLCFVWYAGIGGLELKLEWKSGLEME
ncbi:peptidyl-prolyl cis-trans isomerase CYP95-like [Neltuma alba]|uniref:peptidyl-prolyl cis-trans isomerase CYP95-like n=1 Tax=Neltuma alba TaxID=207710 RepID=UPI0010A33458|nr:peptidyl-prolyl cis-trans isomerase CYP95-like [Prosopis alba]